MGDRASFTLETAERDGLSVVALHGELDLQASPVLDAALQGVAGEDRRVVLDLRGLRFMDSTGLALILRYHQQAKDGRFDLVVVRGPDEVHRVFQVTGTDTLLEMLDLPPAT